MSKFCQEPFVRKEPCINGRRNVKITNYIRENGKCRPYRSTTNLFCNSEKKQFCKCNVVDDLHYRTYDGQSIHFSGGCRYTLTQYHGRGDSCSFNIEVQNEYRGGNKHLAQTKSVIIHMFGEKFELGQQRTLKIGNIKRSIPYEKGEDVRIFYSHNVVQFVASKCSVHVAFDKQSNIFIDVPKKYSRKMNGICGNCNGIHDDLRTKSGKDVSRKKDKYSRIANSYRVTASGEYCKPAHHISYKELCSHHFIERAKYRNLCSAIISRSSPFRKCGQQAHVDLKNFYEDCLIDMCVNRNRRINSRGSQCRILGILSEVCAVSGVPGIKWRTYFNCRKKCGKNEHFTEKASPCPRTCENHFFGTRRPCYDLPEREGCECNRGYIRDGALCVKPMHCKCINLCVDKKGSENCRKWKARGDCEKFQEAMNILCTKTCNFCKPRARQCENEISNKKCSLFRRQGLCFDEFYRSICGLTCNYEKCKCSDDKVIVEKCNKQNIVTTTTHYSFARDSNGRCVQLVKQTHVPCCHLYDWTDYGTCNYCTGKLNITSYSYEPVKMKCIPRSSVRYENCERCPKNARERYDCINDKYLKTTVYFNRLNGCFQCVADMKISIRDIKCRTTVVVTNLTPRFKCYTIYKRTPLNCKCHVKIIRKCECITCEDPTTRRECRNGAIVYTTISYKCISGKCIPNYSTRTKIPKCPRRKCKFGKCLRKKNGKFYCKAIETQYIAKINANCKCVIKAVKYVRTCCCKPLHKYKKCDRKIGRLTTVTVYYEKIKEGCHFKCIKRRFERSISISSEIRYIVKVGKCRPNCKRTAKIFRNFRDGCKRKTEFYRKEIQICPCFNIKCCRKPWTESLCEYNHRVIKRYKEIAENCQCVKVLIWKKEFPISCPGENITETECIDRKKTVTTISYYKHNCKCIKSIKTEVKACKCKRRIISTKTLDCISRTCRQIQITVSINEDCQREQLVCNYVCCCRPRSITATRCNPITGEITTTITTFYISEDRFKCLSKSKSTIKRIICNKVKVIKQRCGQERKNYKKITTIRQILSRTCGCRTIRSSVWKCCKLPRTVVTKYCRWNYYLIKTVKYRFDQHKINCIPQTFYSTKIIRCPPIRNPFKRKYLNKYKCKYQLTILSYVIQNCKCILRKKYEIHYRCCKKRKSIKCVNNNKLITRLITFIPNFNVYKRCRKNVREVTEYIFCLRYVVTRKTPIINCQYKIITDYYRVKNCKCEKYNTTIIKRRICCKKPKIIVSCVAHKVWRVTTITYRPGIHGQCIGSSSFKENAKKCPDPYSVVCPCRIDPSLKSIKHHFYESVNCKCMHRMILIECPCHRIPNKIKIGPCIKKRKTVKVFKSVTVNYDCWWKLLLSYKDICGCKKDRLIKKCVQHSINRAISIKYKLVKIPSQCNRHRCIKSKIISNEIVVCNKDYNYYKLCIDYRKPLIQCVHRSINCKCEMSCRITRYVPCDCHKLDYCEKRCIRNVKYTVCHKHKPCKTKCCKYSTYKIPIVERCSPKRHRQCKVLKYPKNNCYYKLCRTSFYIYRDCQCVVHTVISKKCFRCRKPKKRTYCINNRRVVKTTQFFKRHNRCDPVITEQIIIIDCPRWRVIRTRKHGYTHYKLTYYKLKNCKCVQRICHGPYFKKKCPFSKLKRRCSRNNQWIYTRIVRKIYFTHRRFCPEVNSGLREQICVETRKTRIVPKRCPPGYFIITCIVSRNIKRTEIHYYKVINCRCVKAVIVEKKPPCEKCREDIDDYSTCGPLDKNGIGYIRKTTRYWKVTRQNICKPHIKKSKIICRCRPKRKTKKCVNGKIIFKTFIYQVSSKCKPIIKIVSESVSCYNNGRPNKWRVVRIHRCRRPFEYTIKYLERMKFNPTNCQCILQRKSVKIGICCKPCKYRTVCRHDYKSVIISSCQRAKKLKCVNYKIEKITYIKCPLRKREVIGNCKGKDIRYRIVSYKSIKCRCEKKVKTKIKKKIPDVIKCIGKGWETTHVEYELSRHRCVPRPPKITYKPKICSSVVTFKDKRINSCDFSRSYFIKVVSNCKCIDKLVRQEILHYKCCKTIKPYETCSKHKTRVVVITTFYLVDFKCYPIRKVCRYPVDCSHLKLKERIEAGLCTFKIVKYFAVKRNCKCYRKHKLTLILNDCCRHLKPYKTRKCDRIRGIIVITYISYKLVNYKCPQKISIEYLPINCDGKICKKRYGKCIRNTRTIELFCLKRQGCKCVKTIFRRYNVCCGRRKGSLWTVFGKCGRPRKYYKLITTYALRLHPITHQCRPVIVFQQYRVCRCPRSFVRKSCLNNIYIKTRKVSYKKNIPKNVCDKRIDESISLVPRCHKTLIFIMNERETTPEGWCIRTSKVITPVKCKCIESIKQTKFWCPCYKPVPVKRKRYCKNNEIVIEIHTPNCRLYNIYWKIVKTIIPIINCSHRQILYGQDFLYPGYSHRRRYSYGLINRYRKNDKRKYCTRVRYKTHLQWFVRNCKCRRRVIKRELVCTKCRAPHQKKKCLISKKIITNYSYSLINEICRRHINRRTKNIPCPNRPKIHHSRCFNNKYTITTTHYFYDNCRCRSRVERRICDCQCRKNSKVIKCSRNYFLLEITKIYYKKNCRCFRTKIVKRFEPSCPRFIPISIGKCNVIRDPSIYKKEAKRHIRKYYRTCKCKVKEKVRYILCDCVKRIRKSRVCINNNIVHQTWGWKPIWQKNRCEKVLLKYVVQVSKCLPSKIIIDCDYDIGKGTETTIKYFKINCKCVKHKFVKHIPCPCKTNRVLVYRGKCSRYCPSRRIDIYKRKVPRGKHCLTVKEKESVICSCCPNKSFKFCRYNRFVTVHIAYKLVNNRCLITRNVINNYISCPKIIYRRESPCYKYGFKIIFYYGFVVQNCKCIKRRFRVEFCRCRCPRNKTFVRCDRSGKAVITIQYTYRLIGCHCFARRTKYIRQIRCPSRNVFVSKCNEVRCKVFWFRTTRITNYLVRHCTCVSIVKAIKSICRIDHFIKINVSCDRLKKMIIRIETTLDFVKGKCIKITKEKRIPIICNSNWRIANKPVCRYDGLYGTEIRVYERLVYRDCGCHLETKIKRCNCRCTGPSMTRKCKGGIIYKYFYQYKLGRCKCMRKLIKKETKRIHCESKPPKIGSCFRERNRCVRYVEYRDSIVLNCQCIERRRTVRRVCYSCCDNIHSTERYCNELSNKIITKITGCRVTYSGYIRITVQVKEQGIICKVGSVCVSMGGCNRQTSTETLRCTITKIRKCVCITKTETKRDACICGPPKEKDGNCNLNLCTREVYRIESNLVSLVNDKKTCHDVKIKLKDEICCCRPRAKTTEKCVNNKLILSNWTYTFNDAKKICESSSNEIDITENCEPAEERIPGPINQNTCEKKIKIITRKLVMCKCMKTERVESEFSCCLEDRTETKCVDNMVLTINYKYSKRTGENKCVWTTSHSKQSIECPTLDTESFHFNINDLESCKKTVYEVRNCKCVPVVTNQGCCSLSCPKDSVTETCIPQKGVYRVVNKKYKFNPEGCKCTEDIKTEDKQIKCLVTPTNEITKAAIIYENGVYDRITTYSERKENCECIKQSSIRYKLNKCNENYKKSNSHDANYDYMCEKEIPLPPPPPPPVVCPDNSTYNLGNGRSRVTYYVIENGRCVEKTIEKSCESQCKVQYCVEDSSVCDPSKCSDSSYRAICPIKCGVCVECTAKESNCEINPHDEKPYRKRN